MADLTNEVEVEGDVLALIHASRSDDGTGTKTTTRTVCALAMKDDLTVTVEEENEDFNPAYQKRTRRIRTNNTIDVEASTAMAADLSALSLLGIVDADGKFNTADEDRKLLVSDDEATTPSEFLEIAYFNSEPDWATVDVEADSELLHRFENAEITNPEFDGSATPPMVSFTAWIEGDYWIDYVSPP